MVRKNRKSGVKSAAAVDASPDSAMTLESSGRKISVTNPCRPAKKNTAVLIMLRSFYRHAPRKQTYLQERPGCYRTAHSAWKISLSLNFPSSSSLEAIAGIYGTVASSTRKKMRMTMKIGWTLRAQSINQPLERSINQSDNQSIKQSSNQSSNQWDNQSINRSRKTECSPLIAEQKAKDAM